MVQLQDQRALVTGAGRGIGRAIALALARAGARVAVLSRSTDQLAGAAEEINSAGGQCLALTADHANRTEVDAAVQEMHRAWGGIDILVNNAGVLGPIGPLHECDPDQWMETIQTNLGGCYLCTRAVLPGMIERQSGCIISLSGGGAVSPRPWFSAYGASKAAIVRLTETLAAEVAGYGIRVNAIAPGAVNTDMTRQAADAGPAAGAEAQQAADQLKQPAPPDRAAELVVFLASPAAGDLTGRLLSAQWDDWEQLDIDTIMNSDAGTVRRIKP